MEFSRPEYWSGQPFPSPGDLPNPAIKPRCPELQANSLPAEPPGKSRETREPGSIQFWTLHLPALWLSFVLFLFFFLIYFLIEGWSLYRTVLVSAKPQHESAWLSLLTAFSLGPSPRTTDWFIRSRIGPSCATSSTALRRIQWDKHIQKHSVVWCPSFFPEMISASQLLNVSDQSQTARKHKVDYISDIIKLRTALLFFNQYLMSSKLTWLKVNKQKLLIFSFVSCLLIV